MPRPFPTPLAAQENRAFDHYYGTHQGVRGFNDRAAVPLRSGLDSLYQPVDQADLTKYQLPFHTSTMSTSSICMPAPAMDYVHDMLIINEGRFDSWNTGRPAGMGQAFFNRSDLPYYYTLYESFVAGDQYFQSTFTCTDPNRLHLFSGSNGLSMGFPPVLDNTEPTPGWRWETMGETLENAGVSWKVYEEADNFDDSAWSACVRRELSLRRWRAQSRRAGVRDLASRARAHHSARRDAHLARRLARIPQTPSAGLPASRRPSRAARSSTRARRARPTSSRTCARTSRRASCRR